MFNLLVSASPWDQPRKTYASSRVLQSGYSSDQVLARFAPSGIVNFDALKELPTLFVQETSQHYPDQLARVGTILSVRTSGTEVAIEYRFDQEVRPIPQNELIRMEHHLGIVSNPRRGFGELSTTHWAVKDFNLYRALFIAQPGRDRTPKVFTLPESGIVQFDQLSAMMPFDSSFSGVFQAIRRAAQRVNMRCDRVDGIWENHAVIQDVISLIDRSAFVICDCTGRNPNVFYEIGIAHSLGKEVILITQNGDDIPFDLRHLRYQRYLNNNEGLTDLEERLFQRLQAPLQQL
ncbi:hypothetical protein [Pseudomonas sp. UBA4194]|uniref:hypothetical protein n=1 Tax=Pseudomonas sp. UBA4194 TaxID=1947317 RepID=UPI0025D1F359|nr:hypothetical protein [Pseudomonas sp. UBA4194]